ncbi:Ig-like domain-containing protein [Clostridium neuense]|uniref:Ig-like domain-containing protein n=1 Tax=Clostridium neuense TaxID=1728934 RepID=A0ABW8TED3_9CLOT
MKKKLQVALVAFLVIIFGCFSEAFAASRTNIEDNEFSQIEKKLNQINRHNITNNGSSNHNAGDEGKIGTENLDGSTENSAKKGDVLKDPEIGWKRYDDCSKLIKYLGDWAPDNYLLSGNYNSTLHRSISSNSEAKFNFNGTKLRIITSDLVNAASNIKVTIDDKSYNLDETLNNKDCTMTFEITGLDKSDHKVTISKTDEDMGQINLDAVDIDSDGSMLRLADGLTLDKALHLLKVGQTDTLTAAVTPYDTANKNITWSSSDPSIASIDSNGKLTALKAGIVTITASTMDGSNLMSSCIVTIEEAKSLSLNKTTDLLNVGDTDNLVATVTPNNIPNSSMVWISSMPSIVSVDSDGKVTALKPGTAMILVGTKDGSNLMNLCTITVK